MSCSGWGICQDVNPELTNLVRVALACTLSIGCRGFGRWELCIWEADSSIVLDRQETMKMCCLAGMYWWCPFWLEWLANIWGFVELLLLGREMDVMSWIFLWCNPVCLQRMSTVFRETELYVNKQQVVILAPNFQASLSSQFCAQSALSLCYLSWPYSWLLLLTCIAFHFWHTRTHSDNQSMP